MNARTVIIGFILIAGTSAQADRPLQHEFSELHRLSTALTNFNFPEKGPSRITVWRQGGGKGISSTVDDDEMDLSLALHGIDGFKGTDLSNVAVISEDGRSIRFIDYRMVEGKPLPKIKLKRGDVVALMVPK